MADIRIKDLATTASTTASDDFLAVDGTTNGTRKLSAATPSFATSVTVPGVAGPTATNLTLTGGSTGASLVLGQGASGAVTITPQGTAGVAIAGFNGLTVPRTAAVGFLTASNNANAVGSVPTTNGVSLGYNYSGGDAEANVIFGAASSAQSLVFSRWSGSANTPLARLVGTGNLLIGGTTDITGSGGLKVFGTTAASSTTTGALQVAGGVGVAGGIYAGAASVFGGSLAISASGQASAKATITNTDTASYAHLDLSSSSAQNSSLYQFGSTYTTSGRYIQSSTMLEAGGAGGLNLATSAATPIRFYTNGDNLRLTIDSAGAATFAGAVTGGAITSTGASAALNVNGTSGAVIATVSSGSSIAGSGQSILSLNISDQQWSVRNAAGPFSIRDDTSGNYYLNITRATGAVRFHAYGAGTATFDSSGNITSVSDARLKNITGTFTKGLAEIVKLTPKLYTWKPDTGLVTDDINATLIAQDLIAAGIPEAVTTYRTVAVMEDDAQSAEDIAEGKPVTQHAKLDADGKPVTQRVDANYSVSDRTVIAALVNAVKELKAEIDALKAAK